MPSPAKANLSFAVVFAWAQEHPGFVFAVFTALVGVGYAVGLIQPLDWWGSYEARW